MSAIETDFIKLIKTGNLEEIQQFYNNNTINISANQDDAFQIACYQGHIHVAKWLLNIKPDINFLQFVESVFQFTCIGKPDKTLIDVAKWLVSIEPTIGVYILRQRVNYKKMFKNACKYRFELAQFLFDTKTEVRKYACKEKYFWAAIKKNQLDIATWLASLQQTTITHVDENDDIFTMFKKVMFIILIKTGNLEKVQDFYSLNTSLNISVNNEEPFRTACEYGYLHIAEWLLQTKNDINVSIYSEDTFKKVCTKGHLEMAKFLLNIEPDIKSTVDHDLLEDVFDEAPDSTVEEMIKLLFTVNPEMFIQASNSELISFACSRNLWNIVKWLVSIKPSVITKVK